MEQELHEECGVFGVYGQAESSELTYHGLHSLQHRGQEGAGIATADGETVRCRKGDGLLTEAVSADDLRELTVATSEKTSSPCWRVRLWERWRWHTTARSSMPISCGGNWKARAVFLAAAATVRLFCTLSKRRKVRYWKKFKKPAAGWRAPLLS